MSDPSKLHALLIGIDKYLENELPDGCYYGDLTGCVRDINHVERFLVTTLGVPSKNILKLTASDDGSSKPAEPPELWPTYENIVAGFETLMRNARPGDQLYIHYSGHGGRVKSLVPELKSNGLDESLVPTNIGYSEARYLRDIEIARLLRAMADRKFLVTLVLDSCHSAGMTRGPDARIRGVGVIDTKPRRTDSLVGTIEELAESWHQTQATKSRSLSGAPWVPAGEGTIVLSACGPSELAYEYAFDGVESNGALTYWFLNSLRELGDGLTYKQLYQRVVAKVHSYFANQTPHLEGDGNRTVFGIDRIPTSDTAVVMAVDVSGRRVLLSAGQAHGVRRGAEFAILNLPKRMFLGVAKISSVGITDSWAKFRGFENSIELIQQGDQAELINPGSTPLLKNVRLLTQSVSSNALKTLRRTLELISEAINRSDWLRLVDDLTPASYQLALTETAEIEILDSSGKNLTANVPLTEEVSTTIVQRLEHLAKYHDIQELDNYDKQSPLAQKLVLEWAGYQHEFEYGDKPAPIQFPAKDKTPTVKTGDWVFLRIKNLSTDLLNVVMFDLQPDLGISQAYPTPPRWFVELESKGEELVPLQANLPEGFTEGRDILKVFASLSSANFSWLQMPSINDENPHPKDDFDSPLDRLAHGIVNEQRNMRNVMSIAQPSREWTTSQIELNIIASSRRGSSLARSADRSFILLRSEWTVDQSISLIENLDSTHVIVRSSDTPVNYFLFQRQEFIELVGPSSSATLNSVLDLDRFPRTPFVESNETTGKTPSQCVIVEDSMLVGFFDATHRERVKRRGKRNLKTSESTVSASLVAELPEQIVKGRSVSLLVYISPGFIQGAVPIALAMGEVIDVLVQAERGLVLEEEDARGQLTVSGQAETLPLQFKLRAIANGTALVKVCAFHKGQHLGLVTLNPNVVEASTDIKVAPLRNDQALAPATVHSPDLSLFIKEETLSGKPAISFLLTAADASLNLFYKKYGPVLLQVNPFQYFQEFFKGIENLPLNTNAEKAFAETRLASKGSNLFQALMPVSLQTEIWKLQSSIKSVEVYSEEPWVPWELCKMFGEVKGRVVAGPFFAEAFNITRWIPGVGRKPQLSLQNVGVVVPQNSVLPYAAAERSYMLSLARRGLNVSPVPATFPEVLATLASGKYDGFHFSGHGVFSEADPNRSRMVLEKNLDLTPEDITGEVLNLGLSQPIVFLNACQLGRAAMTLTGVGGWASQFLGAGAGAFIGTYWSVLDDHAYNFARAFYDGMLQHKPIGQAVREARLAIKNTGDPTWLAYTVFADSLAEVR